MKVDSGLRTDEAGAAAHVVVVEEDREQPDVVARRLHLLVVVVPDFARRFLDRVGGAAVELDQLEGLDLLRLAVFGDLEVALLQVRDRVALVVGDDDVDADEIDAGAENRRRLAAGSGVVCGCGGCCAWLAAAAAVAVERGRLLPEDEQQGGPGGDDGAHPTSHT